MADIDDDVSRLNVLVRDLVALKENRLTSPDRLIAELDVRIDDFRNLLDNPPRNDNSRKKLESGGFILLLDIVGNSSDGIIQQASF